MIKIILGSLLLFVGQSMAGSDYLHHQLNVKVFPNQQRIEVQDQIRFPAGEERSELIFKLNSALKVSPPADGLQLDLLRENLKGQDQGMDQEEREVAQRISQNEYRLYFPSGQSAMSEVTLNYTGKIHYTIEQIGEEYARGFSTTPGIIDTQGVYLAGSSNWIPAFGDSLFTFELNCTLPQGWDVVSQGKRTRHEMVAEHRFSQWNSPEPMEEVFLIAAKFFEYSEAAGAVQVMAFLRSADPALAGKYLETTAQYLEMYRQLVGPFPFSKFALVENFWETGYGMPSFTLLGEKVIRFPFILHSSYPHELLHNWWGNSAYVDFKHGNWCEGLTAYMADHLIKEQRGQGAEYRRSTLQKYTNYVTPENDFPLSRFISRTNPATEAIGYGKSLMLFNMLRNQMGDESFIKTMQTFYRQNKYKFAAFDDIRQAAEQVTGKDFKDFFGQWVERVGAPELRLSGVDRKRSDEGYKLTIDLSQVQPGAAFNLDVPVAVLFKEEVQMETVHMTSKQQQYQWTFQKEPMYLQVDPQFQIFRKLHPNEIPPSLSNIFGAEKILILLPSAEKDKLDAYRALADLWSKDPGKDVEILADTEISKLPADRAVWVFGRNNKFSAQVEQALRNFPLKISQDSLILNKTELLFSDKSVVLSARHPYNSSSVVVWLSCAEKDAIPGLARKLPHYGKYSYLAFEGSEPTNVAKGEWPTVNSPMNYQLCFDKLPMPALEKRPALAQLAPVFSAEKMKKHVDYLASAEMAGRALGSPQLDQAAHYIADQFKVAGLKPGADDGSFFQSWPELVDAKGRKAEVKNVIGVLEGTNPKMAGESVVVSAHYDHLGLGWPDVRPGNEGKIHFGADDNASGVAVMLEMARIMAKAGHPQRTIIFVAFTAEESGRVGSKYYVQHYQKYPVKKVIGNINLDTVGRLGENKLLVLNSQSAREWKFIFMGAGYVTGVDAEMVTQPLDASDQGSFIAQGIPAVQLFSGANRDYHKPSDTADKIDAAGMVKVATFAREGIAYLAEREEPLNFSGEKKEMVTDQLKMKRPGQGVTTGSMPDFSYSGKGVRIGELSADSPAAKAGMQKGDVIIALDGQPVENLRSYAAALKKHKPGDTVEITFLRAAAEFKAQLILIAR